jgi:hypothetical protein
MNGEIVRAKSGVEKVPNRKKDKKSNESIAHNQLVAFIRKESINNTYLLFLLSMTIF